MARLKHPQEFPTTSEKEDLKLKIFQSEKQFLEVKY